MNRAKRRAFCRRWSHLPAGARCARCGADLTSEQRTRLTPLIIVLLCIAAALVGSTLGAFIDYLYL